LLFLSVRQVGRLPGPRPKKIGSARLSVSRGQEESSRRSRLFAEPICFAVHEQDISPATVQTQARSAPSNQPHPTTATIGPHVARPRPDPRAQHHPACNPATGAPNSDSARRESRDFMRGSSLRRSCRPRALTRRGAGSRPTSRASSSDFTACPRANFWPRIFPRCHSEINRVAERQQMSLWDNRNRLSAPTTSPRFSPVRQIKPDY